MAAAGQTASGGFFALLLMLRQNEKPIGRACSATSETGANSRALNAVLRNIHQDLMLWIE